MGASKENLDKFLNLLQRLLEQEGPHFRKRVETILSAQLSKQNSGRNAAGVDHIFEELSGKYIILDPRVLMIDYDWIDDERLKNELTADCYEMGRHRLGRINHQPNFIEFCRYAHMQAEGLVNFFIFKYFNNHLLDIKRFIERNSTYIPKQGYQAKSIGEIDYAFKLYALKDGQILPDFKSCFNKLFFLKNVRNTASHRATSSLDTNDLLKRLKQNDPSLSKEEKREAIRLKDIEEQDFESIFHTIQHLAQIIEKQLTSTRAPTLHTSP